MKQWKLYIPFYGLYYAKKYISWWVAENWGSENYFLRQPFNVWPVSVYQTCWILGAWVLIVSWI